MTEKNKRGSIVALVVPTGNFDDWIVSNDKGPLKVGGAFMYSKASLTRHVSVSHLPHNVMFLKRFGPLRT